MNERTEEVRETAVADTAGVTTTKTVATDSTDRRSIKAERIVYTITGILEALLGLRILLSLLGAHRTNDFAQLIYGITAPFVAPFFGLFGYTFQYGESRFEIETLVAMAVYALIGWAIAKFIRISRA